MTFDGFPRTQANRPRPESIQCQRLSKACTTWQTHTLKLPQTRTSPSALTAAERLFPAVILTARKPLLSKTVDDAEEGMGVAAVESLTWVLRVRPASRHAPKSAVVVHARTTRSVE
jgi:hypothetical protein